MCGTPWAVRTISTCRQSSTVGAGGRAGIAATSPRTRLTRTRGTFMSERDLKLDCARARGQEHIMKNAAVAIALLLAWNAAAPPAADQNWTVWGGPQRDFNVAGTGF